MKLRWICAVCALLCAWTVSGQGRAKQLLSQMQTTLAAYGAYEAEFSVEIEGMAMVGTMAVEGEHYWIRMGQMEAYGDNRLRYEINHDRREVTLMPVEQESTNLLSNPAQAFALVAASESALLTEQGGVAELLVMPKNKQGQIRLWLNAQNGLPSKIRYEQEGVGIDILIRSIHKRSDALPRYEATRYADYEVIDFR